MCKKTILLEYLSEHDILYVKKHAISDVKGAVIRDEDTTLIMVNSRVVDDNMELEVMAHEAGHALTDQFCDCETVMNPQLSKLNRRKNEHCASFWQSNYLLPASKLKDAFASGLCTIGELSEYFGLSYETIERTCVYYTSKGLI